MKPLSVTLLLLSVTAVLGAWSLVALRRRDGPLPLRRLIVVVYLLTYVASGYAHVLGLSTNRGYYEASAGAEVVDRAGMTGAAVGTLLGLVALLVGLFVYPSTPSPVHSDGSRTRGEPESRRYSFPARHRVLTLLAGGAVTAVSAYGLVRVRTVVASLDVSRVIAVDGGMARFANLAQWLPWGVTFIGLALLARRPGPRGEAWNAVLVAAALGAGYLSSSWAGGRTDIVLFAVPVLAVFLPRLPTLRRPLLVGGAALVLALVRAETLAREGVSSFDLWDLLDWQFGRFSMLAFAVRYVDDHGYLAGETLLTGYLTVPAAVLHLLGVESSVPTLSIVQVTGQEFSGTNEAIFMVPGMSAELYMNAGYAGSVVGYVVLGVLVSVLSNVYAALPTEVGRLAVAYVGAVVLLHSVNAQSGAAPQIVLFGGAPLFVLGVVEYLAARRGREADRVPGGSGAPGDVARPRTLG